MRRRGRVERRAAVIAILVLAGCSAGSSGDAAGAGDTAAPDADTPAATDPGTDVADAAAGADHHDAAIGPDGTADPGLAPDSPADEAPDGVADVPSVACGGVSAAFPTFSRACGADGDCTLVYHQTDCCGTKVAWGIAATEKSAYYAAETACEAQYPGCGCAEQPTRAQDGQVSVTGSDIRVACLGGQCTSYVGDPCAAVGGLESSTACATDTDCELVFHQTDCCGTLAAWGIRKSAVGAFSAAETVCDGSYPACTCPPGPTTAQDGNTSASQDGILAACRSGTCTSYVLLVAPDAATGEPEDVPAGGGG
jgi:hypothetical protein